ncbi:hypothetical protein L2E82_39192 [Cichorium intybus]|uniref:Uncharacterized protein n=1 Tax=Cichorium intybus TaxID=13427 RepID=A0ACB9AHI4_CICIN|nr:hypothetical protein L2E82_39192 [Cichorium intybus]
MAGASVAPATANSSLKLHQTVLRTKKLEVRKRVQAQLGRIEEETKSLATIPEIHTTGTASSTEGFPLIDVGAVLLYDICYQVSGKKSLHMLKVKILSSFSLKELLRLCQKIGKDATLDDPAFRKGAHLEQREKLGLNTTPTKGD